MSEVYQRTTDPPGVMPRNARYVLFGAIAFIVLTLSMWSGPAPRKAADQKGDSPVQSARIRELKHFQAMLTGQGQGAAPAQRSDIPARQLEDMRADRQHHMRISDGRSDRDPAKELMRRKDAGAPFASITVLSVHEDDERLGRSASQLVRLGESDSAHGTARTTEPQRSQTGSGVFLPEREGDLYRIYESTLVRTILTNRLDGTFTGPVICTVTEPVMSKEKVVLIPTGSRFLGEARRVEERNQQRLAVWFDRLLLPNGYSVPLEKAPGLNSLGETGLKDKTDHHYLRRFSFAGAIGLLGGLRLYGGRPDPYGFESGVMASAGSVASNDLARRTSDVPTITIREGHVVNVYLANDLLVDCPGDSVTI
jgi:type IV secretion system protein TrbI